MLYYDFLQQHETAELMSGSVTMASVYTKYSIATVSPVAARMVLTRWIVLVSMISCWPMSMISYCLHEYDFLLSLSMISCCLHEYDFLLISWVWISVVLMSNFLLISWLYLWVTSSHITSNWTWMEQACCWQTFISNHLTVGCIAATDCNTNQWKCDDGVCIPLSYRCNGLDGGCWDGSDEKGCPGKCIKPAMHTQLKLSV